MAEALNEGTEGAVSLAGGTGTELESDQQIQPSDLGRTRGNEDFGGWVWSRPSYPRSLRHMNCEKKKKNGHLSSERACSSKMGYIPGKVSFLFFSSLEHSSGDARVSTLESRNRQRRCRLVPQNNAGTEVVHEWIESLDYFFFFMGICQKQERTRDNAFVVWPSLTTSKQRINKINIRNEVKRG